MLRQHDTQQQQPAMPMTAIRSPENATLICERIASGDTIRQIAADLHCEKSAITLWMSDDPDLSAQVARARSAAAHVLAESVVEIADDESMLDKPPQWIINRCNQRRWLAGRYNQQYADQQKTDVNVRISWESLIQQAIQQRVEPPTINQPPQDE